MNSDESNNLINTNKIDSDEVIPLPPESTGPLRSARSFSLFKDTFYKQLENRQPRGYNHTLLRLVGRYRGAFLSVYFVAAVLLAFCMFFLGPYAAGTMGQASNSDEKKLGRDLLISAGVIFAFSATYMVAALKLMSYMEKNFGGIDLSDVNAHFEQIRESLKAISEEEFLANDTSAEIVMEFMEQPFTPKGNERFFQAANYLKAQPLRLVDTSEEAPTLGLSPV